MTDYTPRYKARLITDDFGVGQLYRRCYECRRWKAQRVGEFYVRRRDPDTRRIVKWDSLCCECRRVRQTRYYESLPADVKHERSQKRWLKLTADSEEREQRRADNREVQRRRRQNTPEKVRAVGKRYYENLKVDPVRYEAYLQTRRMQHRLRQEREGHTVTRNVSKAAGAWRASFGNSAHLPIDPLAFWLDAVFAQDQRERVELAEVIGVDERALWRMQNREHSRVSEAIADTLIWRYGRPVLIHPDLIENTLVDWAKQLPGNGTRLLRYLDRAEQVAHLGGVVVDRIEDLWPHLEDE